MPIEQKAINLQDILRLTPYVPGLNYGLSEDDFLSIPLYTDTSFENRIDFLNTKLKILRQSESSEKIESEIKATTEELSVLNSQKDEKVKFERYISGELPAINKPMYIRGYSGSGKSTYLGKLLYDMKKNNHIVVKFDLVNSKGKNFIWFFEKKWENLNFHDFALAKLLSLTLHNISIKLCKSNDMTEKDYVNALKSFNKFLQTLVSSEFETIKIVINDFIQNASKTYNDDEILYLRVELYNQLYEVFFKIFKLNNLEKHIKNRAEAKIRVKSSVELSLEFLFLLFWKEHLSNINVNPNKKFIFAVDSLEHFIDGDRLYDTDVTDIIELFRHFMDSQEDAALRWFNVSFRENFKIIISYRDTTIKMLKIQQQESDEPEYEVIVNDWFLPDQIVKNRFNYFNDKIYEKDSRSAIECILADDVSQSGLYLKLTSMHNQNKRRLFEYLTDIIKNDNRETKEYLSLYNKAKEATDRSMREVYISASRSFLIGMLFYKIKEKGFFNEIATCVDDRSKVGNYYARKILTFLHTHQNDSNAKTEDELYCSFYTLLKGAFQNGNQKILDSEINDIAHVLKAMDESDKRKTHWCQLVVIKYNDEKLDFNKFKKTIAKIYREQDTDTQKFGVKITDAGRFFLSKLSDFEYFSVRYYPQYKPLFHSDNFMNNNCLKIISTIRKKALLCIDAIIENDDRFFRAHNSNKVDYSIMYSSSAEHKGYLYSTASGNREITHPESIINNHINYLDFYRHYILDSELSNEQKETISRSILDNIEEYINKLQELLDKKSCIHGKVWWYITEGKDPDWFYCPQSQVKKDNTEEEYKYLYFFKAGLEAAKENPLDKNIYIRKNKLTKA